MTDKHSDNHLPLENILSQKDYSMAGLKLNLNKYREDIREYDYTPEQENQMLQAVWEMMIMMVNLGWGIDSVHMLLPEIFEKAGADSGKSLKQNIPETFSSVSSKDLDNKETNND